MSASLKDEPNQIVSETRAEHFLVTSYSVNTKATKTFVHKYTSLALIFDS